MAQQVPFWFSGSRSIAINNCPSTINLRKTCTVGILDEGPLLGWRIFALQISMMRRGMMKRHVEGEKVIKAWCHHCGKLQCVTHWEKPSVCPESSAKWIIPKMYNCRRKFKQLKKRYYLFLNNICKFSWMFSLLYCTNLTCCCPKQLLSFLTWALLSTKSYKWIFT